MQVPADFHKFESRALGAVRLTYDTQESVPDDIIARMVVSKGRTGWLSFLPTAERMIRPEDVADLPEIRAKPEEIKSKAQRLRAVLYRLWEVERRTLTSEEFYDQEMELVIESFKRRLRPAN